MTPTMHPKLLQARIVALIENTRINVSTEASAHAAISAALTTGNIDHTCEVRLTDTERIDIMAGTVGIEIKVNGSRMKELAMAVLEREKQGRADQ